MKIEINFCTLSETRTQQKQEQKIHKQLEVEQQIGQ
jgi:hypothetical protein